MTPGENLKQYFRWVRISKRYGWANEETEDKEKTDRQMERRTDRKTR